MLRLTIDSVRYFLGAKIIRQMRHHWPRHSKCLWKASLAVCHCFTAVYICCGKLERMDIGAQKLILFRTRSKFVMRQFRQFRLRKVNTTLTRHDCQRTENDIHVFFFLQIFKRIQRRAQIVYHPVFVRQRIRPNKAPASILQQPFKNHIIAKTSTTINRSRKNNMCIDVYAQNHHLSCIETDDEWTLHLLAQYDSATFGPI